MRVSSNRSGSLLPKQAMRVRVPLPAPCPLVTYVWSMRMSSNGRIPALQADHAGPSPVIRSMPRRRAMPRWGHAPVAQSGLRQLFYTQKIRGSNPRGSTAPSSSATTATEDGRHNADVIQWQGSRSARSVMRVRVPSSAPRLYSSDGKSAGLKHRRSPVRCGLEARMGMWRSGSASRSQREGRGSESRHLHDPPVAESGRRGRPKPDHPSGYPGSNPGRGTMPARRL